jgi:hypothetical protein
LAETWTFERGETMTRARDFDRHRRQYERMHNIGTAIAFVVLLGGLILILLDVLPR